VVVPVPWSPRRPGPLPPFCDPPRRSEPRGLRRSSRRADEGFDPVDAGRDSAAPWDVPGVVEGVVLVAGVVAFVAATVPAAPFAEPVPDGLEVLVDREDDEPPFRRALRAEDRLVSCFVAVGFVAVAGAPDEVSVGAVAGFVVAAGVAVSAPVCGLAVPALVSAAGAGSGLGAVAGSAGGVVGEGASAVPVGVPLPSEEPVPLPGPLLLLDAVEPGAAGASAPWAATATLALLRLVSAMTKAAPTNTRPKPRREWWPPGRSGRWRPTLRTAARGELSHKASRASNGRNRPSVAVYLDRLSGGKALVNGV